MNSRFICSLDVNTKKLSSLSKSMSDIYGERGKKGEITPVSFWPLLAVSSPVQVLGRVFRNRLLEIMPVKTVHGAKTRRR
jgi:hypothetical protein